MISRAEIDCEQIRRKGLHEFVKRAWSTAEAVPFQGNWHVGFVCEALEAAYKRELRYLVINIPPGTGKSRLTSVFYPAWVWAQATHAAPFERLGPGAAEKFIYATYADRLAERDADAMRNLVMSQWYRERWSSVALEPGKIKLFVNAAGGWRFSTTIGGQVTGEHANQLILDDPLKAQDAIGGAAETRRKLEAASSFWEKTMATRLADPVSTVRIMIMQRLHDADPAGVALEAGMPDAHVCLPMRAEAERRTISIPSGKKLVDPRVEGELLWPDRYPEKVVAELEVSLGDQAEAQLQQRPVKSGGQVFKRQWFFRFWTFDGTCAARKPDEVILRLPTEAEWTDSLQSWDMTFKDTTGSDFVAGTAWIARAGEYFLRDLINERLSFTDTLEAMLAFSAANPRITSKLIEDKANGPAVVSSLKQSLPGLEEITPDGGKVARANAIAPIVKSGNVILPHPSMPGFEWVHALIKQLTRFPKAKHDDMVDSVSQALMRLHVNTVSAFGEYASAKRLSQAEKGARTGAGESTIRCVPWSTSPSALSKLDYDLQRLPCHARLLEGVVDGTIGVVTDNPTFVRGWLRDYVLEILP